MKFYKIDNYWWELDGDRLYNAVGGHQMTEWHNPQPNEIVEVNDWQDLDWSGTEVYDNTLKTGWINRDGIFFGCGTESHSTQANYVHKKTQRELETLGWIKVYVSWMFGSKNKNGMNVAIHGSRVNELQKNALYKLDFTEEEIKYI